MKQNDVEVEEHEFICDKCDGFGFIQDKDPDYLITCPKCQGAKKVDWIENAVGKKPKPKDHDDMVDAISKMMVSKIDKELTDIYTGSQTEAKEQTNVKAFTVEDMIKEVEDFKRRYRF